ncbi:PIR protein [Plasmodium vivax]|uniref:VIR protein n=1 Tax=Plasmodium vivax TaxID=5855 RepID=A0A565A666_PLAVI|nr:PIR protein [Plasmodium vivax]
MFSEKYCYFKYGDYADGIKYFNKAKELKETQAERLQKIMDVVTAKGIPSLFYDLFKKLHIYLSYDMHIFVNTSDQYCRYINFWLNNEALQLYNGEIDNSKFSIFDTFVEELNKRKHSVTCKSYLHCINSNDALKKMKILYELYDDYDTIMNKKDTNGKFCCNTLSKLRRIYNETIKQYDGNEDELIEKLMDLKKLIGIHEAKLKTDCFSEMSSFQEPTLYLQKQESLKIIADREKEQEEEKLNQQQNQQKQQEEPNIHAPSPREQEPHIHSPSRTEQEHQTFFPSTSYELQEHSRERAFPEVPQLFKRPEDLYGSGTVDREGPENPLRAISGEHGNSSTGYYRLGNRDITPNNEMGFFEKMKGGITGVLGEIDPVPVVGVSGGMGALFLLFRYTPFGTFFRGGRGRAHRIPRSFNGQFLGGFPGYEEYDVGHILYGPMNPLAE